MTVEKNRMIPMRDGVKLATDVYKPDTDTRLPVLVARTPYNKDFTALPSFVEAGYIVAVQDVRGRFSSEGDFYPYVYDTDDGLDFFEWVLQQPWCDGNIGTFGGSYLGGTQWLPARKNPRGLRAMVTEVTFDSMYDGSAYQGGAKVLHDLLWTAGSIVPENMRRAREKGEDMTGMVLPDVANVLTTLPLADHPAIHKYGAFYHEWLAHPTNDAYWPPISPNSGYDTITVPSINITGWYDIFVPSTIKNFNAMKKTGGSEPARVNQQLIIGPWTHGNFTGQFAEMSFGENASADAIGLTQIKIDWYNHFLKGMPYKLNNSLPVKIFVMGVNEWRDEADWPLPDTDYRSYYLHGGGGLSGEKPGNEPYDAFTYDPMNPVPTLGGQVILPDGNMGPKDQQALEKRSDILIYDTPVLEKAVEVIGNVQIKLYASSDCLDTDFTAKLVDVYPDGRAMLLTDGILRARFRESFKTAKLLEPGSIYELTIDMAATANAFLPGHRIRLEVSGGNFPKFNRNSNTGGDIYKETTDQYQPAHNKIYHDTAHASRLILPVII